MKQYKKDKNNLFKREIGISVLDKVTPYIKRAMMREENIFLIGADVNNKTSMRFKIQNALKGKVNILLPEDIFEEDIFLKEQNMLSLENILAQSVDAVVMCIESPGSFTELGAFANHQELNQKLIVCQNKKFERAKSFINLGPIKYLKQHTPSIVFSVNYDKEFGDSETKALIKNIKVIKKNTMNVNYDLFNPLFAERFVLALLYVFDSIEKQVIIDIIKHIDIIKDKDEKEKKIKIEKVISTVNSSLSTLSQKRHLTFNFNKKLYSLSNKGKNRINMEYKPDFIYKNLDVMRIKVLNFQLRENYLRPNTYA
ncbi:retron St85 family effector protein [Priestia megaterium]